MTSWFNSTKPVWGVLRIPKDLERFPPADIRFIIHLDVL